MRGAADRLRPRRINGSRRRVQDGDVAGVGKDAEVNPRPGPDAILHMIRLGVGHATDQHSQAGRDGIVQRDHRVAQRRWDFARNHDVETRRQDVRFVREFEASDVAGNLAQRGGERITRLIQRGGVLGAANCGRRQPV